MNDEEAFQINTINIQELLRKEAVQLSYLPVFSNDIEKKLQKSIENICSRPEIQPLTTSINFKVNKELSTPFVAPTCDQIILNPIILVDYTLGCTFIRYALELAIWLKSIIGQASLAHFIAIGILAGNATSLYWKNLNKNERDNCRARIPVELSNFLNDIEYLDWRKTVEKSDKEFLKFAKGLLILQGITNVSENSFSDEILKKARELVSQGTLLACPLEYLLTTGGDDRLKVDKSTGLNSYGCSPKPIPHAITFSSTTATSISSYAFYQAEKLRQKLIEAVCNNQFEDQYYHETERIRTEILASFNLIGLEETDVLLTPSGTDAEFWAVFLSHGNKQQTIVNILVGPEETGSGVLLACSGLHFTNKTCLNKSVNKGAPIDGINADYIQPVEVPIRDHNGNSVESKMIDDRINTIVDKAIANQSRILIHIVDSSKTGLSAPSFEKVIQLKNDYSDSVDVVVDASQLRAGNKKLKKYLCAGFMVIITGSKFFTGPPYSGALILPSNIVKRAKKIKVCPVGFSEYFTRYDVPDVLSSWKSQLNKNKNIGLLFRWQAALWEISVFQATPAKNKYLIYAVFGESIREVIAANPDLELIEAPTTKRWKIPDDQEWDWLPTIFTFSMHRTGSRGQKIPISFDEAKKIYQWLNMDLSSLMPFEASESEIELAKKVCHLGQPVKTTFSNGEWVGTLRISAGARMASGISFDPVRGRHFAERLSREIGNACTNLDKISLIMKYMNYIEKRSET